MKTLLSSEIRINGKKVVSVGESDSTDSCIEESNEGGRFKVVTHHLKGEGGDSEWDGYECLRLDVIYGPLPKDWDIPEEELCVDDDNDPYLLLTKQRGMTLSFIDLHFIDGNLRKGSAEHSIAVNSQGID